MRPVVLILSCAQDLHAQAVRAAVERRGGEVRLLCLADLPGRLGLSLVPSRDGVRVMLRGTVEAAAAEVGDGVRSVWARRWPEPAMAEEIEECDRIGVEREVRAMREALLELLCPETLWVNPWGGSGRSKPAQLATAARCGFAVPETLMSNDPEEIVRFVQAAPGRVVYKTFSGLVPTTVVTEERLRAEEMLRWTPGIYQRYVEKRYELRVTVIGRRVLAARIDSQQTVRGRIDWREAQRVAPGRACDLRVRRVELDGDVAERCRWVMEVLGLVFGAIDLVVTPAGETVFLEVNPEGQFLWVEEATGLPMVEALSDLLLEGGVDEPGSGQAEDAGVDVRR